jgi:SAM-dependent methyltransferase
MKPALADMPEVDFADGVYQNYARTRPHHPAPRSAADLLAGPGPTFRKRFAPLLPRARDARIADLGCGYGEFLYFLQQSGYRDACGVDLDPAHVDAAQALGVRNVGHADAREFLRSARDYDFISTLDVLEHFPKPEVVDFLALVRHALKPGGRFLCQVPNLAAFYAPLFFMDFTHQTPFTAPSLKQALELAGFTNVRVFGLGPVPHGLRSTARCLLWKGMTAAFRTIQTIEGGPRDALSSIFTASIAAIAERS